VDHHQQEQIALHRWAVIAEAAGDKLTARGRGALARQIAARAHAHPDGSSRTYSRGTIDRWLRAWRKGGLQALMPAQRADTGVVRAHPELFAEAAAPRLELPGRSAAQIASILYHRHGITVSERTVRGQLRAGTTRCSPTTPSPGCTGSPTACPAPSTTPPPRRSSPPRQPVRTSSTMPAPRKPSPSSPATSRTAPGGPATLKNPAVATRVRHLAARAEHRRAIAEFRARRAADQQARVNALLLEAIAALASLLGAPGPHPIPAARPHIATSTCQNVNTECCRLMCKHRGR